MICQLEELVNDFKGEESQTRCFTHILNLIVKSIIQQFNIPKAQADKVFDEVTTALMELAGNIDAKEQEMAKSTDDSNDDEEDKNLEGWVDERATMTVEQLAAFDKAVQPVRLMIVKLCKIQTPH
jgi:hypothetical protein